MKTKKQLDHNLISKTKINLTDLRLALNSWKINFHRNAGNSNFCGRCKSTTFRCAAMIKLKRNEKRFIFPQTIK